MERFSARYVGRVQGVGFRATARSIALGHGVTGWVRNEPDGSVYVEAEGDEIALKSFSEWCKKGPRGPRC
ncbi:MAG: acylphosphatase [Hydrococcus sp. CSU_1_8]|nr:acylphosphatase [Hydrococcus sp. CSU_1_8]